MTVLAPHTGLTASGTAWILAEAARLKETLVKDKTYRETPVGRIVGKYLDQLAFRDYAPGTIEQRESLLARLAARYAHLELVDLTTDHFETFLVEESVGLAPATRKTYTSHVKTFVAWAHDHDHVPDTPTSMADRELVARWLVARWRKALARAGAPTGDKNT